MDQSTLWDTLKWVGLSGPEHALGHFEMGVIMITFQRRNITRRHRMHFGNALAVQKLIDLFSAEELEVESPDPDVEDDEEDDGDGWKRQTVES